MISDPIVTVMVDNGDGTYHYDFTLNQVGKVTIQVILTTSGLAWDYYTDMNWSSTATSSTVSDINVDWGLFGPYSEVDTFSNTYTGYFKASSTEGYVFDFENDDGTGFIINFVTLYQFTAFSWTSAVSKFHL